MDSTEMSKYGLDFLKTSITGEQVISILSNEDKDLVLLTNKGSLYVIYTDGQYYRINPNLVEEEGNR